MRNCRNERVRTGSGEKRFLRTAIAIAMFALCAWTAFAGVSGTVGPRSFPDGGETVKTKTAAVTASAENYGFATTQATADKLRAAPTIAAEIVDEAGLSRVYGETGGDVQNAIFHLNADLEATGADGTALASLADVRKNLSTSVIPNFYISDKTAMNAFIGYAESDEDFIDVGVISANTTILNNIRRALPYMRAILDVSGRTDFAAAAVTREACETGAQIVLLSDAQATRAAVEYMHARMKTTWTKLSATDEFSVVRGISSGTYGLVCADPAAVAAAYRRFDGEKNAVLSRMPLNVAHRGAPYEALENSLSGMIKAYEGGATHLEIDAHLTKDKQIVIMHDPTLSATTDGTGTIASMTLDEIRQYKLVKNIVGLTEPNVEPEEIPTIDDVFSYFQDKDVVFFFEIKTSATDFTDYFGKKIEEYDMRDKIVVISFDRNQLRAVRKELPYLSAFCLSYNAFDPIGKTISELTSDGLGLDVTVADETQARALSDRGFMNAYWTYDTYTGVAGAIREGVFGITNNDAVEAGKFCVKLNVTETSAEKSDVLGAAASGKTFRGELIAYNGATESADCSVLVCRDMGDYAEVIFTARYAVGKWSVISDVVRVGYAQASGCGSALALSAFCPLPALCIAAAGLVRKKRG